MLYNKKLLLSESERNRISNIYNGNSAQFDFVISDWLSPDEKYVIFLDELYDIQNKTKLGNIWENFENFKFFLKHSFEVATNVSEEIREDVLSDINKFVITESTQNLSHLKSIFREILNEQTVAGSLYNFGKNTITGAVKNTADFFKTSYEGAKKTIGALSQGDWNQAINIVKKGALYVARKIRAALYNPIGLILDAILVATNVGKLVAWIPWAIAVGLDIYEFITGNYEDPDLHWGWRLLFTACDIMGLIFAGAVSKPLKTLVNSMIGRFGKTGEGVSKAIQSSPKLQNIFKNLSGYLTKAKEFLTSAQNTFKTKSPMLHKFMSDALGGFNRFATFVGEKTIQLLGGVVKTVGKILSAPGKLASKLGAGQAVQSGANVGGLVTGIGTYTEYKNEKSQMKTQELAAALQSSTVEPDYDNIDWS